MDYQGMLYIPYYIEGAKDAQHADDIVNEVLDILGRIDLGKFSWDDPDWSMRESDPEIEDTNE